MMKKMFLIIAVFLSLTVTAQQTQNDNLPYYQIPDYPESYSAGTVAARMVDGLGFRFYWATEGLRPEDLQYKPSEQGRTCQETLDHIYGLSKFIYNATAGEVNDRTVTKEEVLSFEEKRKVILTNFKKASELLRVADDLSEMKIKIKNQQGLIDFPFWNNINGPIADALWHTGQVVLLRRASGNPINPKVSVFTGRLRD